MPTPRSVFLLKIALLSCCFTANAFANENDVFIKFQSENLILGRSIWIENCKGCHAYGTAGAPIPMVTEEWQHRVKKDKAVLYDHAINGFFGEDDTMMPERGGNTELSDKQVKQAVDYMYQLATFYIDKQTPDK